MNRQGEDGNQGALVAEQKSPRKTGIRQFNRDSPGVGRCIAALAITAAD